MSKLQCKVGDAGVRSRLFHEGHIRDEDDNDVDHVDDSETKSCAESFSDKSSVMASALFHKARDKIKDNDDVADVEESKTKSSLT